MVAVEGILSIQSHVAYGHVGNCAAVFPLQRLGFEVWSVNTVQFSNHTGYGVWKGHANTVEQIREILSGVEARGAFGRVQAVVSGYLGDPLLGDAVLETVAKVRAARPGAVYACDPVMGDVGRGFFVRPGIPEFFRDRAVPLADIVTPNAFELAWLADRSIDSLDDALAGAAAVRARGPSLVVVTSLELPGAQDEIVVLADTAEGSWLVRTPKLPLTVNGTGDATTALVLGNRLTSSDVATVLQRSVSAMYELVRLTHETGSREIELIAAQDAYGQPPQLFPVERVR
ncbi:MAG TPA: pyridoxal kinase PdxY [Geminicoccus sp.]|jgi:pyridoxine kinase|uniref:pyridoxal kinase PdxY n=1 Tax=Geminicoccus sp. TaxID=2024832 RepID=UPI002E34DBFF|nr:pyridoxal kinase PdxY [Geminicoccus sp.]HEX2527626.1 pyridoxal kinase PdxY [Geminicoccus sp.]